MKENKPSVRYKMNKLLLKKVIMTTVIIFIISVLYSPVSFFVKSVYYDTLVTLKFKNSDITIKVPKSFSEIIVEETTSSLGLAGIKTEEKEEIKQDYVNILPELIYKGYDKRTGIGMALQEKMGVSENKLTPKELAERYHVSAMIKYEDANVYDYEYEVTELLGAEATKVTIDIDQYNLKKDSVETIRYIAYLIPLDNKEVTVEFFGLKNKIEQSQGKLQKIIKSMKNN